VASVKLGRISIKLIAWNSWKGQLDLDDAVQPSWSDIERAIVTVRLSNQASLTVRLEVARVRAVYSHGPRSIVVPFCRKIFGVSGGILGSKNLFRGAEPPEVAPQALPYHEFLPPFVDNPVIIVTLMTPETMPEKIRRGRACRRAAWRLLPARALTWENPV
jgi:hypothetical protein